MDKNTIKNKNRTSNIDTKRKINNRNNMSTKNSNLQDYNFNNIRNNSEMKLPKIPKSVEKVVRNNVERKSNIEISSSVVKKNNNMGNGIKKNTNKNSKKSPKIPKSVEKAIKNNEGRKISENSINNVKGNTKNSSIAKDINKGIGKKNIDNLKKKKRTLILTFIVAIIICVSILLIKLPYFNISDIEITGTNKYTKEEILEKSNIVIDENIFIQTFKCNKKNITTLPYVDNVSVHLKLPNKINIKIKERVPKYFAYDNETFYKLSEDGYILEKTDINSKTQDELLITGIPFYDSTVLGNKIDEIYMNKILTYELIQDEYDKNNFSGKVTKVNFVNSLTTLTINDKLNVVFPNDTELEYKMKVLKKILDELGEDAVGKIDMTKTNPTFSSF